MTSSIEAVQAELQQRFPDAFAGSSPAPAGNEFVIFSKPELGRLGGEDLTRVWDLFAGALADHEVTVHTAKIITGPELDSAALMQQHYGVINQISRLGASALTESAADSLAEQYGDELASATVLGGHQFLERFDGFSPFSLAMLFSNAAVKRLGPGSYAAKVGIDGEQVVILNGFHPRQLSFFIADDAVCAFLHGTSATDWETLRSAMIGATDPSKAEPGSIRGRLYADPAGFGLSSVNSNFNGVHMSAGPLEGLAELDRFFGSPSGLSGWTFGAALVDAGVSADDLPAWTENPVVEADGQRGSAFDLTEGLDAAPAATLLASATRV